MCPIRNKIRQKDSSEGEGGRSEDEDSGTREEMLEQESNEDQEDIDDETCSVTENTYESKPKMIDSPIQYGSNNATLNVQQLNSLSDSSSVTASNVANDTLQQSHVPTPNAPFNMHHIPPPILS